MQIGKEQMLDYIPSIQREVTKFFGNKQQFHSANRVARNLIDISLKPSSVFLNQDTLRAR